jgi:Arc/MetJ-type ribon-helix-helix transcriptional regulator
MSTQTQTQKEQKVEFTTIYVSKETRKMLARIKIEGEFRNYDEVIKELLRRAGYGDQ